MLVKPTGDQSQKPQAQNCPVSADSVGSLAFHSQSFLGPYMSPPLGHSGQASLPQHTSLALGDSTPVFLEDPLSHSSQRKLDSPLPKHQASSHGLGLANQNILLL